MKKCGRCGIEKPLDEFSLRPSVKKGLVPRSYCKQCASEYSIKAQQALRESDPDRYREMKRANARNRTIKRYGLTPEDIQEMGNAQKWLCYMCGVDISEKYYLDHNHENGKVRKLLCFHCNVGLGHFRDSPDLLGKAISYLEEHDV